MQILHQLQKHKEIICYFYNYLQVWAAGNLIRCCQCIYQLNCYCKFPLSLLRPASPIWTNVTRNLISKTASSTILFFFDSWNELIHCWQVSECLHISHLLRLNNAKNSIKLQILLQFVAIPFPTLEGPSNLFQIKYSIALELFPYNAA